MKIGNIIERLFGGEWRFMDEIIKSGKNVKLYRGFNFLKRQIFSITLRKIHKRILGQNFMMNQGPRVPTFHNNVENIIRKVHKRQY